MQRNLLSLIGEGRPRRALFTTYTFSISWFETIVLPALRKTGCEQIDVLVDSREERKSTDEATCLAAGIEFRVIPVLMPGKAVFHPKLVYMRGDTHDHLVVSSGNLTLGGFGKNLEVVDAVASYQEPAVFGEFADFIEDLVSRLSFAPENKAILFEYAHRARQHRTAAGDIDEAVRRTWLVHTLRNPAADQFAVLADRIAEPSTLTVLSPYHSPSGQPVQNLADAVGAANIRVGIGRNLRAPFDKASMRFTSAVEFVAAETAGDERFPHAKCFELQGRDSALVMTGSVNATSQSLETTTNVEVSLVRLLGQTPFTWEAVQPTEYRPCDFRSMAQAAGASVQATWLASQRIRGAVYPAPGEMRVRLEVWGGEACLKHVPDVALNEKGEFDVLVPDNNVDYGRALRIVLARENLRVSGWLNVEVSLAASDAERSLLRAARRMRDGEFSIDDLRAVLEWLQSVRARRQPPEPVASPGTGGTGGQAQESGQAQSVLTYDAWRRAFEDLGPLGASTAVTHISLEAALAWLNSDLEGEEPDASVEGGSDAPARKPRDAALGRVPGLKLLETARDEYADDVEDEGDGGADSRAKEEQEAMFQSFVAKLPNGLEVDAKSALVPMIVELTGGAVVKRALAGMGRPRKADPNVLSELLVIDGWLNRYSKFEYGAQNRAKLLPFFCALACCAAHYHRDSSLETVNEALQQMAGRAVPAEEIEQLAIIALHSRWLRRIPVADHASIAACAHVIAMCETLSQKLEELITIIVTRPTEKLSIPREFEKVFGAVRQHRRSADKVFGNVHAQSKACPCCYVALKPRDITDLLARRAALCTGCQRALFTGLDKAELAKKGLAGRYKG
ncbi:hypothetical protein [Burkholderia thailandensis]|uniref:hypothetical protein n=1 Tax=Burkholderia thailandensis TaxID=57975 RepID=UPI002166793D|nr:hypothetical protein [Burkholderia thailandensis]MCS3390366.1 hypothetical protein [Burkholderia thailandensis]